MKTGPKPQTRKPHEPARGRRINSDAQERLTQEFEALSAIARKARETMERDGVVVEGSKGSPVLSPETRVYQFALGQMRLLLPVLHPDADLRLEGDEDA